MMPVLPYSLFFPVVVSPHQPSCFLCVLFLTFIIFYVFLVGAEIPRLSARLLRFVLTRNSMTLSRSDCLIPVWKRVYARFFGIFSNELVEYNVKSWAQLVLLIFSESNPLMPHSPFANIPRLTPLLTPP